MMEMKQAAEVYALTFYIHHRGDELSRQLAESFRIRAEQKGLRWSAKEPDIVVSIGGDGTLLQAFHTYFNKVEHVAFVGVHTGHLGFYADWKPHEIGLLIDCMARNPKPDQSSIVEYPIVEITVESDCGTETYYALNEVTLKGIETTLVARLDINDAKFEMFRGDGICISTPSGSTAYNRALGGAMIHPSLEAIQIAEIASINNRIYRTLGSPIVLPKHHHCDIYPEEGKRLLLSIDHIYKEYPRLRGLSARVADMKVKFVRYRPFPFWNRVRDAFIGNGSN